MTLLTHILVEVTALQPLGHHNKKSRFIITQLMLINIKHTILRRSNHIYKIYPYAYIYTHVHVFIYMIMCKKTMEYLQIKSMHIPSIDIIVHGSEVV